MSHWYSTFDAVFFTGIATMIIGLAGIAIKYGFASKCDNVELCCGIIKIHRAVEFETINPDAPNETEVIDRNNNDNV